MTSHSTGDEYTVTEDQLEMQRPDLATLLDGLTEKEAQARLVPSLTTPLGLVKHAIFVEQVWFHHRLAGAPHEQLGIPQTIDESFTLIPDEYRGRTTAELPRCLWSLPGHRRRAPSTRS